MLEAPFRWTTEFLAPECSSLDLPLTLKLMDGAADTKLTYALTLPAEGQRSVSDSKTFEATLETASGKRPAPAADVAAPDAKQLKRELSPRPGYFIFILFFLRKKNKE